MLSSTLPAFCGQKRTEFGFPFFSSQLCQVEARFGQQVSYLYIYICVSYLYMCPYVYMNINIHITYSDRNIGVCKHMYIDAHTPQVRIYVPLRICSASES